MKRYCASTPRRLIAGRSTVTIGLSTEVLLNTGGRRRRAGQTTPPADGPSAEVEAHHPEQGVQEPFGLAQREMVEESQGQGGLDGEIRVAPLPTPSHRRVERGLGYRPASSQRGTSSCMWDGPSTSSR